MDIIKDIEDAAGAGMGIQTKLIIGLGAALALGAVLVFGAHHFEAKGRDLERAGWLAKQVKEQQADAALVRKHEADMQKLRDQQQATERETSEKHEQELAQLRRERDADRIAVDHAGGLRIDAGACTADRTEPGPEAAGAGQRDEASASTVRLPQPVEDGLWRLANDADEVSAQLRACQGWIRANGFYGPPIADDKQLLGRIVADQHFNAEATQ